MCSYISSFLLCELVNMDKIFLQFVMLAGALVSI